MMNLATTTNDRAGAQMARRAAAASTVGSVLEWIDFTAYGILAATLFPRLFFPSVDPAIGVLLAFATFGVGFFARPLGGLIFGMLGDRLGRKTVLLYTLSLMGLASFLIGCLPTYGQVGVAAPIALVALRFLQGLALGGESTGAQLLTMEHAPRNQRGFYGSFINIGSSLSAAVANGVMFSLLAVLGEGAFESWGWRVPFLLSVVLVALGLYIRRTVQETPAFLSIEKTVVKSPMIEALRRHPGTILRLLVAWCMPAVCFYVINVYSLGYISKNLGMPSQPAFLCLMGANILAVFTVLGGGALSDRIGRKPTMLIASALSLVAALSYFALLDTKSWLLIFVAMAFFVASLQIQSGVQPAYFAEPFPASVRYSGSAAAYTGASLFASAPTPFVAAWLVQSSGGQTWVLTAFCVAIVIISAIAIFVGRETRGVDLNN
jgi:MFS family permease